MELLTIFKNLIVVAEMEMKIYLNDIVHLAIKSMEDKNDWMLRKEAIDLIFTILKILGSDSISSTKYESRAFSSLQTLKFDKIQGVREAAKKVLAILPQNQVENVVIKKVRTPIKERAMNPSFVSSPSKDTDVKILVLDNNKQSKAISSSSDEESEDTENSSKEATSNDEYQISNDSFNEDKSSEKPKKPRRISTHKSNRRNEPQNSSVSTSSELEKLTPSKKFNLSLRLESIKKSFKDPQSPRNQSQNLLNQINQNLNQSNYPNSNQPNNQPNNQYKQNYQKSNSNQYLSHNNTIPSNNYPPYQNNFQQEKIYPNPSNHFAPNIYTQQPPTFNSPKINQYPLNQNVPYSMQPQNLMNQFEDNNNHSKNFQHEELKSMLYKVFESQQYLINKINEIQSSFERNLNTLSMRIKMLEETIEDKRN